MSWEIHGKQFYQLLLLLLLRLLVMILGMVRQ
jgi:hypothetical protein